MSTTRDGEVAVASSRAEPDRGLRATPRSSAGDASMTGRHGRDPVAGCSIRPCRATWCPDDAIAYARGIGAGDHPDEAAFVSPDRMAQRVLPTFAAVVGGGLHAPPDLCALRAASPAEGRQRLTVFRELPVDGAVEIRQRVVGRVARGTLRSVRAERTGLDAATGERLFVVVSTVSSRGGRAVEPDPGRWTRRPERSPDVSITDRTTAAQALLHLQLGDRSRLHADSRSPRRAGPPVLHDLCTFGIAGRAVLRAFCGADPGRFRALSTRFAADVVPGDDVRIDAWLLTPGRVAFRVRRSDGTAVLVDGEFEFQPTGRSDGLGSRRDPPGSRPTARQQEHDGTSDTFGRTA